LLCAADVVEGAFGGNILAILFLDARSCPLIPWMGVARQTANYIVVSALLAARLS